MIGKRMVIAPIAIAASLCFIGMAGCGGDDGGTTTNPGTGGGSGTGGTGGVGGGGTGGGGTGGGGTGGVTGGSGGTETGGGGVGGSGGGEVCPGATECGGVCVNTDLDPAHCGGCDNACQPGEVCSNGMCGIACAGGTTECNGLCVDTNIDPANCGSCGNACNPGEVCSGGSCGVTCTGGTTECSGACVDTDVDPANCGSCANACDPGEVCSGGSCGITCTGGTTECNGVCVDTNVDPANCGGCANQCDPGEVCSIGLCAVNCSGGTTECSGACVNTNIDPDHCGTCGNACNPGEVCSSGTCGLSCSGGTTECGGACVDTDVDPANCGSCGNACDPGDVCSAGTCGLVCTGGTTACGGACVDTNNDPANCGGCSNQCPPGEVCSGGSCGLTCSGGTTECAGTCVDTNNDPANCGSCGNTCNVGQVCSAGTCTGICGGGLTKCGNYCVDTQTDNGNCGTCGTVCTPTQDCIAGVCTECNSATTDCDGDGWLAADGDCCDKPGVCGSEPEKVNPGAIEVIGNGIDDNCNSKTDLFDTEDTVSCDAGIVSNTADPVALARALGICRTTTEDPPLASRTWGLISAQLMRANGAALTYADGKSVRDGFGASVVPLEGQRLVVLSSGIAADGSQTLPGPNGGPAANQSADHGGATEEVSISTCTSPYCISDWFSTANPPLKAANQLPVAPSCGSGSAGGPSTARDSVMLVLRLRAPTNAQAFSFNAYFFSVEYPEFVCSDFNDQFVALVNTPAGTPSPIPNPVDKNLMTYTNSNQKWPIGINIASGTPLFAVCQDQATSSCWDTDVSTASCSLGAAQLLGTGFEAASGNCTRGGGTYWLTTAGNVIPGEIVEVRIAIWDVGDHLYDSTALIDGFKWLSNATLPGTS